MRKILDHFEKFPIIGQKRADFLIFQKVFDIVSKKEHLTTEELNRIVALKANMSWGLSE